jgi:RAP domain
MRSKTDRTIPDEYDSLDLRLVSSKTQHAVSTALTPVDFDHMEEHIITMDELASIHGVRVPLEQIEILSIDIANIEERIAIEVNCPTHYVTCIDDIRDIDSGWTRNANGRQEYRDRVGWIGERQEINGSTALKTRLLQALGWKVIHLPFWEWYAVGGDSAADTVPIYCP